MQKTMITAGRTGCKVMSLNKKRLEATHGTVSGCTCTGNTASNDNYIVLFEHFLEFLIKTNKDTNK
jgi:hypothetical protein